MSNEDSSTEIMEEPQAQESQGALEIRENHELLLKVLDALPSPVFVKDEAHRWILFNQSFCELLGKPMEELWGHSDYDFFPDHEADVFWRKDEEVLTHRQTVVNEEPLTTQEGDVRWLLTTKSPCTLKNNKTLLVGVIQDITHRKLYEESLQQRWMEALGASQTKSLFLTKMSHELRTPLNAIIGYAELLRDDPSPVPRAQLEHDTGRILTSAKHLLALINEILDLAHIESGQIETTPERFSVGELLEELTSIISPLARKRGNAFEASSQPRVPQWLETDKRKLRQILINLLANANKHTSDGQIQLLVEASERHDSATVTFQVRDTGAGIPRARMAHVFEPFVQAHSPYACSTPGIGLGLAISRGLAELLQGELTVQSQEGVGSTFAVSLPQRLPGTRSRR